VVRFRKSKKWGVSLQRFTLFFFENLITAIKGQITAIREADYRDWKADYGD